MATLFQDLRYGVRNLRRARGFAATAALTVAIGIGANTAIFSIIDTVLLRPLPYREPNQLVRLNETEAAPGRYPFAGPDYLDWKAQNSTLQDLTLFTWPRDMNLRSGAQPEHVQALPTAANFFALLGVEALHGRTWAEGEDQPGKDDVAILSYGLWESRFGGDPRAVGQSMELNGRKFTIVGVMPASFRFPWKSQLWIPQLMDKKGLGFRGNHFANVIGRMKSGVTIAAARADLSLIASRLEKQYPDSNSKVGAVVTSLRDDLVGDSRSSLFMMLGAVGLVLLIACANVANLLLARAMSRQKEVAIRSALGASRLRLLRQLLTESLLLSTAGGLLGLLLAWGGVALFADAKSYSLPQFNQVQVDGTVLAFAFGLAIATGVLFGVLPALQMSRPDVHGELKGGAGSVVSPGMRRRFTSDVLVVAEIALSLMLLVSAGLLLKDFASMRSLDIGVRRDGVWTAAVQLPAASYKTDRQKYDFSQALLGRTGHLAGVDSAAITDHLPLEGGSNSFVRRRGHISERTNQLVEVHSASPGYFQAMGIRLVRGRVFTNADADKALQQDIRLDALYEDGREPTPEQTENVVYPSVINESMARYFWPNENPLGQMFCMGGDHGPWKEVIGVVSDVREWSLTQKAVPEAYDPFDGSSRNFLVLHASLPPSAMTSAVRHALSEIDPGLPLYNVRTMDEVMAGKAQGQEFLSGLVGCFAGLAALLAAIGIYGVLSYLVTQRTREIGICMSLGARRGRVLAQVLGRGMKLTLIGLLAGMGGAVFASRVVASLLHEVKPRDPVIFAATAGLLAVIALAACYIPARRAARVDPMTALRYE